MAASTTAKVWFITGCSTGFGRELTLAALARGDHVIATARRLEAIEDLKAKGAAIMSLDVTSNEEIIAQVAADAVQQFGRVDILVNNAGYLLEGAIEECSAEEVLAQFNTNVFGVLAVLRAFLPYMREQKSGVIANIGSAAGWTGFADSGIYAASKFALAGLTKSLREEVAHLGIEVTVIEPGNFRTAVYGNNCKHAEKRIPELEPATKFIREMVETFHGKQQGDPVKGAQLIVELLTKTGRGEGRKLPARLPFGKDAAMYVGNVLEQDKKDFDEWKDLISTTDYDDLQ